VLGPEPGQPPAFGDASVPRPAFPAVQRFVGGDARTDTRRRGSDGYAYSLMRQGRLLFDLLPNMPAQRARPLVAAFTRRVAELPMIQEVLAEI